MTQEPIIFSIIIPFKFWSSNLTECLQKISKLSLKEFELILLPDEEITIPEKFLDLPIILNPTGQINPAAKRDLGAEKAKGEFLAFIDDDAYPRYDWLDVAKRIFNEHQEIGALGGPAVTPKTDPFWARVSGAVFLSRTSGGFPERYVSYPPSKAVDDWPTVNLIVRRSVFDQVNGFGSNFWPGEDTLFCLKIISKTSKTILYVPELVVWHHRRKELQKHLNQVGNYGLHRGHFANIFPKTSRKIIYFVPTLWVAFVLIGLFLSTLSHSLYAFYLGGWACYLAALAISWKQICRYESTLVAFSAIPYIMLSHLWYGIKFAQGFTTQNLKSKLGR
jgi:GT2 family glycosyltransferase